VLLLGVLAQGQTFTTLYSFTGGSDGGNPWAGVIQDPSGNLYGTTEQGGDTGNCRAPNGCGVVFELIPDGDGWEETVQNTFIGHPSDGSFPEAPVTRDSAGNSYGTTEFGGASANGAIFKIDTTGNETLLYSFTGESDGCSPAQGVIVGAAGSVYGTTSQCGANNYGTIFSVNSAGAFTLLYTFAGSDGDSPLYGHLTMDSSGNLYGVTRDGGSDNDGVLYELSTKGTLTVLHSFAGGASDGCYPDGSVLQDASGNLYGTTAGCGGNGGGTIWEANAKGNETILHSFSQSDGCNPLGGVVRDSSDNLYGVANQCGADNFGTVWEFTAKGKLIVLHNFSGPDGVNPVGELLRTAQGQLFGTAYGGGTDGFGTVWSYGLPAGLCNPATFWCGPYPIPDNGDCRSGPGSGSCTGGGTLKGGYNVGFLANPGKGPSGDSSISASDIQSWGGSAAGPDVVPNAAVGTYQYMEFAGDYVQAYPKPGQQYAGTPLFADYPKNSGQIQPQPVNSPWNSNQNCGQISVDYNIVYDHMNADWVISGTAHWVDKNNVTRWTLCIAVSTTDNLLQTNKNCDPNEEYPCSFWSTYAFDLSTVLPTDSGIYDRADYARFGVWNDGNYYVTFDMLDNNLAGNNANIVHGFAACQILGPAVRAGNSEGSGGADLLTCYTYLPENSSGQLVSPSMIHTLLPADVESADIPSKTNGEYFLATVNPGTNGFPCTNAVVVCGSSTLAFWTWANITSLSAPTLLAVNPFTPGCYDPHAGYTAFTWCVPEPTDSGAPGSVVDSVGDRLMSRLAYRYVVGPPAYEYLAATQTVQEYGQDGENKTVYPTKIRYYTIVPTTPAIQYQGEIEDTSLYYWMPSNAIDASGNVGYTFTGGNGTSPNFPSVYADFLSSSGTLAASPTLVQQGTASIIDPDNYFWGPYVSLSVDPAATDEFWGIGQYFTAPEQKCDAKTKTYTGCNWLTVTLTCNSQTGQCTTI
jgi:uncharacterized repeat protein (TIGR03803 family)